MDIDEFYDQDPRRRASDEVEFGREWSEKGVRFEVAWVADTGELYLMAAPHSRRGISSTAVTVEVLAVIPGREAINGVLAGWGDEMTKPDSVTWLRARAAGPAEPRT